MKELIDWLIGVEEIAAEIYEAAAERLVDDPEFASLARSLALEEREHHLLMKRAGELAADDAVDRPMVTMPPDARRQAEQLMALYKSKVEADGFTPKMLADLMVTVEFSEWNDAFLSVCNSLKKRCSEFSSIGPKIQQHKRSVERFIKSRPEYRGYLDRIKSLQDVWHEKILVVDDDGPILDTISLILADEGKVHRAANGAEAMDRLAENYYAAIITDVDMPVMDGIELFRAAVEIYPNIRKRFLFFTGTIDEDNRTFLDDEGVCYILKPTGIHTIRSAVENILNRANKHA